MYVVQCVHNSPWELSDCHGAGWKSVQKPISASPDLNPLSSAWGYHWATTALLIPYTRFLPNLLCWQSWVIAFTYAWQPFFWSHAPTLLFTPFQCSWPCSLLTSLQINTITQQSNSVYTLNKNGHRTSLKLILIICLSALKPHSPLSPPSNSRTFWKLRSAAFGSSSLRALLL